MDLLKLLTTQLKIVDGLRSDMLRLNKIQQENLTALERITEAYRDKIADNK